MSDDTRLEQLAQELKDVGYKITRPPHRRRKYRRKGVTEKGLETCGDCGEPATWMRYTQFAGNHPFCTKHAKMEEDFGKTDPSYFFWNKIENEG